MMKQKYWFNRSLSRSKNNNQFADNDSRTNNNRNRNHKVIFYNETSRKQLSDITEQARKINDFLSNIKHQNKLYHDFNQEDSEMRNQIRCLKHNSIIILYCFTDQKLLCSTCVYGTSQHAKHKVNQAKTMYSRIEQVLISNQKIVKVRSNQVNGIRSFFEDIQNKIENVKQEELEKLEKELQEHSSLLSYQYQKSKNKLIQTFEKTKQEVSSFIQQMRQLSKNMRFEHSLISVRQLHFQQVMDQLNKISRLIPPHKLGQNMLQTLLTYGKTVVSSFKYGFSGLSK